ncbi:MAG: hypothetical protein R2781_03995 [Flavobacteriaceae bacterium]
MRKGIKQAFGLKLGTIIINMNAKRLLNYEQILLKDPLYSTYVLNDVDDYNLINLLIYREGDKNFTKLKTIDSYCPICKKETTFFSLSNHDDEAVRLLIDTGFISGYSGDRREKSLLETLERKGDFNRIFYCPRKPEDSAHFHIFNFRVIGTTLIKIGQHPSISDLSSTEILKYKKISNSVYKELNTAIGLSSHGVGVGSFVYLRRIIEKHMVMPEINVLIEQGEVTSQIVNRNSFKENIKLVKNRLPDFLVTNPKIYFVLSKGTRWSWKKRNV